MRALLAIALLAGCTTGPMAPEDASFVRISSIGPFTGRASDTIFANDTLRRERPIADTPDVRVSWSALPDGTYAQARMIVERDMPGVEEPEFDLCPADASAQTITVRPPVAGITSVSAGCTPNGFAQLGQALRMLLPPWRQTS